MTQTSLRVRPRLSSPTRRRTWMLELEIVLSGVDPEQLLRESEGFLIDDSAGRAVGVVDGVETDGATRMVTGLLVACGWFGRRRVRVDVSAIELLLPAERRIILGEGGRGRVVPAS